MRLNNVLTLMERLNVPQGRGTITVTGNLHGVPVTLNVKLTQQQFDRDQDGGWDGTVTAILGDEQGLVERNEPVDVYLDKDSGKYTITGAKWRLASGAVKPTRPIEVDKQNTFEF